MVSKIEKVVIRKKTVRCTSSNYIMLTSEMEFNSLDELLMQLNMDTIITEVYKEDKMSFERLNCEYRHVKENAQNDYFKQVYRINKSYAVDIREHIILYHLEDKIIVGDKSLVEWYYVSGEMYIGDSWWSDDGEILSDIKDLSLIEFFEKYKGF